MYNRYIPQSDGSYLRNRMPDATEPSGNKVHFPCDVLEDSPQLPSCPPAPPTRPDPPPPSAGSFLRQLLPKGLDTGDLLVIVLLLLMAGDCQEDKNIMLLTLALYLFL